MSEAFRNNPHIPLAANSGGCGMWPSAGIGLRSDHLSVVQANPPDVRWFEVHPENYRDSDKRAQLLEIAKRYPVSLHGLGLSLGSVVEPDKDHLAFLAGLARDVSPILMSEHVSWSISDGTYMPDLLPIPYTQEALDVLCRNVDIAQAYLGRRILMENPSSYIHAQESDYTESAFMAQLAERTGCGILLDVNNVFVSARNHNWCPYTYIEKIPAEHVGEFHLAGHKTVMTPGGDFRRIDTHDRAVAPEVWELYAYTLGQIGCRPTLIEWDDALPAMPTLMAEAERAQSYLDAAQESEGRHVRTASLSASL